MPPLTPGDLSIPGPFSHELVHTRGTRLHCATAGNPQAPLVLLLHDCLGGWFDYQFIIEPLSKSLHVGAMSARGFAQSDKPPSGYSLRHAVGDVSGMIRALGHGRATIVASGTAARIATVLAANYPQRVRSLVLIDPVARSSAAKSAGALLASRFPDMVARMSLPKAETGEVQRTTELRVLSYQLLGTHAPRVKHARIAGAYLPTGWTTALTQPTIYLDDFPQLLRPAECAAQISSSSVI